MTLFNLRNAQRVAVCALIAPWTACEAPVRPGATPPSAPPAAERIDWLVAGGGATPDSNEVSIEDDVALAEQILGRHGSGTTLFAAGGATQAVRVGEAAADDSLRARLGSLFTPRPSRGARYRPTRLQGARPAHPDAYMQALTEAISKPATRPLVAYFAGHGDVAENPADNKAIFWANRSLTARELATRLPQNPARGVRFVFTSCFSGGFAEIAFAGADENANHASPTVCGLFASMWDREAGGCDPDPDRGRHDGYGVHFLNALDGRDRRGNATQADFDGDGRVSLLDAHTHARLSSGSIDVPTTTSERWLRARGAQLPASEQPALLPHEEAVVLELVRRLGAGDEAATLARLEALDQQIEDAAMKETAAADAEARAFMDLAGVLLARWPVLDDPWDPRFEQVLTENGPDIARVLDEHADAAAYRAAQAAVNTASAARADLEVERAPWDRLYRAQVTIRLARALKAEGGEGWQHFEQLRRCEGYVLGSDP